MPAQSNLASNVVSAGLPSSDLYSPFTTEKLRGMFVSLAASFAGNSMNVFGQKVLHLNPLISTALFLQLVANVLVYALDIVFAKRAFNGADVPYTHLQERAAYLWRSFATPTFMKFIITAIIDLVVVVELLRATMSYLDAANVTFRFRNEIAAAVISIIVFMLWGNAVRFNWAYADTDNPVMNIIMIAWVAMALMLFAVARNLEMVSRASPVATKPEVPAAATKPEVPAAATKP
jgi:hypothetical protein